MSRRITCGSQPLKALFEGRRRIQSEKEKAGHVSMIGLYSCRQRPTLPHTFACSTIGPAGLNFRVRDGNGWVPRGKITDNLKQPLVLVKLAKDLAANFQ